MILEKITIKHLRCLEDCEVAIGSHTIIVGANGAGKSTVLEAIRFLCDSTHKVAENDLNVGSREAPIEVTGTFSSLTAGELVVWNDYRDADGTLTISKIASLDENGWDIYYRVNTAAYPGFSQLRELLTGNKNTFKSEYNAFAARTRAEYNLPNVTTWAAGAEALSEWEQQHPKDCVNTPARISTKDAQRLFVETFNVIAVPAVPDIDDALDGRGAILSNLFAQMVEPRVESHPRLLELRELVAATFREIFPTEGSTELDEAQALISQSLALFAPGASIKIGWDPQSQPDIRPPAYRTDVVEDGVSSSVDSKGHGVQRAVIVSMIHALNARKNEGYPRAGQTTIAPTTMLLIEEPELYQHPTRARHLAQALRALSKPTRDNRGSKLR